MKQFFIILLSGLLIATNLYSAHAATSTPANEPVELIIEIAQGHLRTCTFDTAITQNPVLLAHAVKSWANLLVNNGTLDLVDLQLHMLNQLILSVGAGCVVSKVKTTSSQEPDAQKIRTLYQLPTTTLDSLLSSLSCCLRNKKAGVVDISSLLQLIKSDVCKNCSIAESSITLPLIIISVHTTVGNSGLTKAVSEDGVWSINFPKKRTLLRQRSFSTAQDEIKPKVILYEPIEIQYVDDSSASGSLSDESR